MSGRSVLVVVAIAAGVAGLMMAAPAWADPSPPPELAAPPPVEPLPASAPAMPPPNSTTAPASVTSAKAPEPAPSAFDVGAPAAAPGERPAFYERAWFWTALGVVAVTGFIILMSTSSQGPAAPSTDLGSMRAF